MMRPASKAAWLWLFVGFALLPFTVVQTMLPAAAWLAPIFLLRFARTARQTWAAFATLFGSYAIAYIFAARGADLSNPYVAVIGLSTFSLLRGFVSALPYVADRLVGRSLSQTQRALVFPLA